MKHKYLRVAAVACLLIATKCLMEEEDQPLLADLVGSCHGEFTATDLKRMELVVLDKLHWRVPTVSPLAMLHNMTVVVSSELQLAESDARQLMEVLDAQFVSCAVSYELLRFAPSTLAAALLSLELPELTGLSDGLTQCCTAARQLTAAQTLSAALCASRAGCWWTASSSAPPWPSATCASRSRCSSSPFNPCTYVSVCCPQRQHKSCRTHRGQQNYSKNHVSGRCFPTCRPQPSAAGRASNEDILLILQAREPAQQS